MDYQEELKQKISEKLVIVIALTLFTVVLWGVGQVFSAFTPEQESTSYEKHIQPLPTSFDEQALNDLVERGG